MHERETIKTLAETLAATLEEQRGLRIVYHKQVDMLREYGEELAALREEKALWGAEKAALQSAGIQVHQPEYVEGLEKELAEAGDTICERDGVIAQALAVLEGMALPLEPPETELVPWLERVALYHKHTQELLDGAQKQVCEVLDGLGARDAEASELKAQLARLTGDRDDWRARAQEAIAKVADVEAQLRANHPAYAESEAERMAKGVLIASVENTLDDAGVEQSPLLDRIDKLVGERDAWKEKAGLRQEPPDVYADSAHMVVDLAKEGG